MRLKQKTLRGAHSATNLGEDAITYYVSIAYEKICSGEWEWKEQFSLPEQFIRIIDSWISKEVERYKTGKAQGVRIEYHDSEIDFYKRQNLVEAETDNLQEYQSKVNMIEQAIQDDDQLKDFWDAIQLGYKRAEIAEILTVEPRQLEKVKERLVRKVKSYQSTVR